MVAISDDHVNQCAWVTNLASEFGQIGSKWGKSGTFYNRSLSHNIIINMNLKSHTFFLFGSNLAHFGPKLDIMELIVDNTVTRFDAKVGQIGPKSDTFGAF